PVPAAPVPAAGPGTVVKMPALGESVTEGTVTRWLKQVGDTVEADEPLLEGSTDKVDTEIPAPAGGTLLEIRVDQDETVRVGAALAVIGTTGGAPAPAPAPTPPAAPAAAAPSLPSPPAPQTAGTNGGTAAQADRLSTPLPAAAAGEDG